MFWVVFGRGWSDAYTSGELMRCEMFADIAQVTWQCNDQFMLDWWAGEPPLSRVTVLKIRILDGFRTWLVIGLRLEVS